MNRISFENMVATHEAMCRLIRDKKGKDYAGDDDALRNFKEVATRTGQTPFQVWSVYFNKQIMAIETFVRDGAVQSESPISRFHDAINYLYLGLGLIEESAVVAGIWANDEEEDD